MGVCFSTFSIFSLLPPPPKNLAIRDVKLVFSGAGSLVSGSLCVLVLYEFELPGFCCYYYYRFLSAYSSAFFLLAASAAF